MIRFDMSFNASNNMVYKVDGILESLLNTKEWDEGLDMFIAAHELLINSVCVVCSNQYVVDDEIKISLNIDDNKIFFSIQDKGGGFETKKEE